MTTTKSFPTLHIASLITGIGLCPIHSERGVYGYMSEMASHLLGAPVWTHEIAHGPTMDAVCEEAYRQFPDMPTRAEAESDFEAAARKATAAYGEMISVVEGTHGRREHPVDTLAAIAPDKPIVIVIA